MLWCYRMRIIWRIIRSRVQFLTFTLMQQPWKSCPAPVWWSGRGGGGGKFLYSRIRNRALFKGFFSSFLKTGFLFYIERQRCQGREPISLPRVKTNYRARVDRKFNISLLITAASEAWNCGKPYITYMPYTSYHHSAIHARYSTRCSVARFKCIGIELICIHCANWLFT